MATTEESTPPDMPTTTLFPLPSPDERAVEVAPTSSASRAFSALDFPSALLLLLLLPERHLLEPEAFQTPRPVEHRRSGTSAVHQGIENGLLHFEWALLLLLLLMLWVAVRVGVDAAWYGRVETKKARRESNKPRRRVLCELKACAGGGASEPPRHRSAFEGSVACWFGRAMASRTMGSVGTAVLGW